MIKTWEVLRFELGYQAGRTSTRLYFAIVLGLALVIARVFLLDARQDGYFFNAPIITSAVTIIASMIALLVVAGVAGDAATRDAQTRIDSLLYTTPLRKAAYLGGRFLGAFAVTALLLLAVPVALLIATGMPGVEKEILGPFRAEAYLTSYLLFAVPNAFASTAVLFALAVLSRRAITAYAGAVILFFSAFLSETFLAARLGQWGLGKLLDPMGYTTLREIWRSSNPLQKNTLLVGLDGPLLSNRLLWIAIAMSVLMLAFARFRFAYQSGGGGQTILSAPPPAQTRLSALHVPKTRRAFNAATRLRQLRIVTLDSFRHLHTLRAWLIVPLLAVIFVITGPELLEVELGTPGAATTARVAMMYGGFETTLLVVLLIVLSAGELVWRERDARMDAIADAAPVPEWLSYLGKFLGLALMLVAAQAVLLVAGVAVQVMQGSYTVDLGLYATVLFGFHFTTYLLMAALAMVVHVLVDQKYVGNVLVVLLYVGVDMAHELGVRHNLLLYGRAPEWSYSEMAGFGLQVGPWLWLTLYWSGWALLFAVAAYLFWIRGEERGLRRRLALARRRLTRWPAAAGAASLALILGVGGFVFYNTNVLNRYFTSAEVEARRAEYERRYAKYASLPQPLLAATKLHVDFRPKRNAATIRGTYRLENRSGTPIDAIHLVAYTGVATGNVSFDRAAKLALNDQTLGYRIYTLGNALQPGHSIRMNFEVVFAPRGFTNGGRNESVMANGSWFQHRADHNHGERQWLPFVGYQPQRELRYAAPRARHDLPAKPPVPPLHDVAARHDQRANERIDFEAIIATDAGQLGVAPGALRRTWTENGRSYAHYVADAPISNSYAIYSANYAVQRAKWKDVDIEIFHHPAHTANLERMLHSVRASLDYHTRHFAPYPYRQLRLVEYPSTSRALGLTSFPGLIEYSEAFALVRPEADPRQIDFPFAVMGHEMGHQWWGHQIVPASVEGAPLLSESLAWYSAMLVLEETHGREHAMRLLDVMRSEYLAPHGTRETPLLRAFDRFAAYRIGPLAMFALREIAGTERVNAALRNLLAKFDPARPPFPTSLDLYAELKAATPPNMHYLLKDLFEEITYWDLRTKQIDVRPSAGAYRLTLHIDAQKLKGDATGREQPVAMNDLIEVGVFDADGKALYRQPHRIASGPQTIELVVPRKPARAGLDPDHELLDRKPDDNVIDV